MTISLLFFARYQDVVEARERTITVPGGSTVATVASELERLYPPLAGLLTHGRAAVNEEFADETTLLNEGDCIAWMPPMSGG